MDAKAVATLRERVVNGYNAYTMGLIGVVQTTAARLPLGSHDDEFWGGVSSLTRLSRGLIRQEIELATYAVKVAAIADVTSDSGVTTTSVFESIIEGDIGEMMINNMRFATNDILAQMERDARTLKQMYDQIAYQSKLRFVNGASAASAGKAANVEVGFMFMDRAGRRWKSDRYVRTRVNIHLVQTYNETYLYGMKVAGLDEAELRYADPEHERNGYRFSISGSGEWPSYVDVRDNILKPNSLALVKKSSMTYNRGDTDGV